MIRDEHPPEPEPDPRNWVCPGCDRDFHGKPWKVIESPWMCFCSAACYDQYKRKNGDPADPTDTGRESAEGDL